MAEQDKRQEKQQEKRRDDLGRAIEQITKDFGKGAIMRLGAASASKDAFASGRAVPDDFSFP